MSVNLYEVIGCPKEATTEQILAEYRQKVLELHPDKVGQTTQQRQTMEDNVNKRFQQLQFAKEVLTDAKKRKHYDVWLQIGQGMALNDWMGNQDKIQQTFHWAHRTDSTRQILPPKMCDNESNCTKNGPTHSRSDWVPNKSTASRAFRNYQI